MTRKDYIKAAELVKLETKPSYKWVLYSNFVQFFKQDNSRFDADRFASACGVQL
jgi:hypothetical protein